MNKTQCILAIAQYTMYIGQCTVHTVYLPLHSSQCISANAEYSMYICQCTVYNVYRPIHSTQCISTNAQYTMYIVQCTVHNVCCKMHKYMTHVNNNTPKQTINKLKGPRNFTNVTQGSNRETHILEAKHKIASSMRLLQ